MKIFQKINIYIVIIIMALTFLNIQNISAAYNDGSRYTVNSKLASGKWVKIKVTDNAIYKLTYEDIQKMGINPAKAQIYGYGGWVINEDFSKTYVDDLPEVAVWISGSDNKLDAGEYMLFYGRGTIKWTYNGTEFTHENNPYATYGTYFIGETDGNLKIMENAETIASASTIVSTFQDYFLHEKEEYSIARSGRELYGESFTSKTQQTFTFQIPGITSDAAIARLSFVANAEKQTSVSLSINDNTDNFKSILERSITGTSATDSYTKANEANTSGSWTGEKNENTKVLVNYQGSAKLAYLNYIRLTVTRDLRYYNTGYTFFRNKENLSKDIQYNIKNVNSDLLVFDITNNYDTRKVQTQLSSNTLSFSTASSGTLKEYVLVDPKQTFLTPQKVEDVTNQNLHGLELIDMAIIAPKAFVSEAERLAQAHRDRSGLKVQVVTANQIYNEFSSGTSDASAYRRFMKMFYDRAQNESEKPKYLLLFGDAIYDNRFLDPSCKTLTKENFLLTYPSKYSLTTGQSSLPNEDYFGFLDEEEDSKNTIFYQRDQKLGIGRFPVQTLSAAKIAVDKVISYMDNKNKGIWKNSFIFLADDSDSTSPGSSFANHMKEADSIANSVIQKNHPEYMLSKIYLDAYTPDRTGGKKNFDNTAKKKLFETLTEGSIAFNYTGHGSPTAFADYIMSVSDVQQMNFKNLPLWITATCDFAWFDAVANSAGELVFLSEKSAGIALFSTSRVVYSEKSFLLNRFFYQNMFKKTDGKIQTLGDIMRNSKNDMNNLPAIGVASIYNDANKQAYVLIGDPALTLNLPEYDIEIDEINGEMIDKDKTYTFKALEKVTVSGFVKNESGAIDNSFNGKVSAKIFDGTQIIESYTETNAGGHVYFSDYPNTLALASSDVEGGRFSFSFSVPKGITETENLGKMSLYAYDVLSGREANGSFMKYNIFGFDENTDFKDTASPVIESIYLNTTDFQSGDNVNETPYFYAKVSDKYGIDISGSHDIEIIIDNKPGLTYKLNSYYRLSETEENTGYVGFSIPELEEGEHNLTFRIWNILNNSTIYTAKFNVVKGLQPRIFDLSVTSNPAKIGYSTTFELSHNRPETQIEVTINVYDLSGRPVWKHTESGSSELLNNYEIPWDLVTQGGGYVQPGVYVYSATVKTANGTEATKAKKMIVVGE